MWYWYGATPTLFPAAHEDIYDGGAYMHEEKNQSTKGFNIDRGETRKRLKQQQGASRVNSVLLHGAILFRPIV